MRSDYQKAAEFIKSADALLILAGAGIGVDSGLATFRGTGGWYTRGLMVKGKQVSFGDLANPRAFRRYPELAWAFYGRRYRNYQETTPHEGFQILKRWREQRSAGSFVFTSNVDGHFQKAGFSEKEIHECHGSLSYAQCSEICSNAIWALENVDFDLNEDGSTAGSLPRCKNCLSISRPNILLFDDVLWIQERFWQQYNRYMEWKSTLQNKNIVKIEIGAGTEIARVRWEAEDFPGKLIRINPMHPAGPPGTISLSAGGLEALRGIDEFIY